MIQIKHPIKDEVLKVTAPPPNDSLWSELNEKAILKAHKSNQ
jgi:hypothetical protein